MVQDVKWPGDVVIASIHWGSNWGYEIPHAQIEFAHELVDRAHVDVIHGHSSHHVKGIEALMYYLNMNPASGRLVSLTMAPFQIRRFRLNRASREDAEWLRDTLNKEGKYFRTGVHLNADNTLTLKWT
jgi:poly-gamma-glutamate synthesis protein (capsule biosynthesis protein)